MNDNLLQQSVLELVIYKIKPDKLEQFPAVLSGVKNAIAKLEGFVAYSTFLAHQEQRKFTDIVLWNTLDDALAAARSFPQLPEFKPFADSLEETVLFEHFKPYQSDHHD